MIGRPSPASRCRGQLLAGHVGKDAGQLGVAQSADLRAEEYLRRASGRCAVRRRRGPDWSTRRPAVAARCGGRGRLDARPAASSISSAAQIGEESQAAAHVGVVEVDPILIELVGAGLFGRKPQGARLGLAHLAAVAAGQQRAGAAVELHAAEPPGQVDAGRDVAPLIAPAACNSQP